MFPINFHLKSLPFQEPLQFFLNGELVKVHDPDPRQMLIEFLRDSKAKFFFGSAGWLVILEFKRKLIHPTCTHVQPDG